MRHEQYRERLSAHLAGDLAASERIRVEGHIADCPDCRREYHELRHTVHLLRGLPAPEPPPDLAERVIARLRAGEGRPGLFARFQGRILRFLETPWAVPVGAIGVALGLVGIVLGVDVSLQLPAWMGVEDGPRLEVVAESPLPTLRPREPTNRLFAVSDASEAGAAISPMVVCLRGGGPTRAPAGPGDPCEHWDSWMVDLGTRDAAAFVVEVESVPAPERGRVLGRIRDFATRSGSAPLLAGTLRSDGDPRAAKLANRIERTGAVSTR
jgi:hypothetical protein